MKIQPWRKVHKSSICYLCWLRVKKRKISTCHNNHKKSSTTKINKQTPSGYSMSTHCLFDLTKTKLDCYRGKDCMKRFCKKLKEHATKRIN